MQCCNLNAYHWVRDNVFSKEHDIFVVGGAEKHHLTVGRELLLNPNGLILMSLRCNHDIGLIKNKNSNFLHIEETKFQSPIQNLIKMFNDINVKTKLSNEEDEITFPGVPMMM